MIWRVTQDYIRRGTKFSSNECPIALVGKEMTNACVTVWGHCIIVNGERYDNEPRLTNWIIKHDDGEEVLPITIELLETEYDSRMALIVGGGTE